MKTGYELFAVTDIEILKEKGWSVKDGNDRDGEWWIDLLGCHLKKQNWEFEEFLNEVGKQMENEKLTYIELFEIFV
tara:strand:+ start:463 stop:690 length:228 start_codon:yes stop_codon:yes gene_type:complete